MSNPIQTVDTATLGRTVLRLDGVSKSYRRGDEVVRALDDVDLGVRPGEMVIIRGPSGAGKSTLLHVAAGLEPPDTGRVLAGDAQTDVYRLKRSARARWRRHHVGLVFQFFNLIPTLDAVRNVALPLLFDGVGADRASEVSRAMLRRLDLGDRLHHLPAQLSGGQMQRVAVARALVTEPTVVLADEPTGNLDATNGIEVLELLAEMARDGTAVLLVTHEMTDLDGRELWLEDGRLASVSVGAP